MADMILDVKVLPEPIFSRIHANKVKVHEENGSIILTPIHEKKPQFEHLIGIFSDGKISIDKFLLQKQLDKELEN
jgi:virulence-associated protein VagC